MRAVAIFLLCQQRKTQKKKKQNKKPKKKNKMCKRNIKYKTIQIHFKLVPSIYFTFFGN